MIQHRPTWTDMEPHRHLWSHMEAYWAHLETRRRCIGSTILKEHRCLILGPGVFFVLGPNRQQVCRKFANAYLHAHHYCTQCQYSISLSYLAHREKVGIVYALLCRRKRCRNLLRAFGIIAQIFHSTCGKPRRMQPRAVLAP